jgi:hypothetical protein
MIKREHIKQAIDAISGQNPEIGYSLDEMFGMGRIDVAGGMEDTAPGEEIFFLFDGEKVAVNKVLFFDEGTVPIEQGLLIKYGERVKRTELQDRSGPIPYQEAWQEIHAAGLQCAVVYEIDRAMARLKEKREEAAGAGQQKEAGFYSGLVYFLEELKEDPRPFEIEKEAGSSPVVYRGLVEENTPATFMCFPMHLETLMQVADINVEFFSVRFILSCLMRGLAKNLMACIVDRHIVGLLYLVMRERFFKKDLEIKFFATLRGKGSDDGKADRKPLKGVGTFLVAGVWMLWKNGQPDMKELVLNSEVEARRFYAAVGFESRGLSGYVLKEPKGYLLKSILHMTAQCRDLRQEVIGEMEALVRKQVKALRKKAKGVKDRREREIKLAIVKQCLAQEVHPALAKAAFEAVIKDQKKIPESDELMQCALTR